MLGGTGLIGAAIARACLDAAIEVAVLARHSPDPVTSMLFDGATVRVGSATDPVALRSVLDGADHVVDALGTPHPAASVRDPVAQFDAEVPILLSVLDLMKELPGAAFTFLSSGGAIYGDVARLPVREETECHPLSPYGVTKLAAEGYALMASKSSDLDVRILRIANAYGSRQRAGTGQGLVASLLSAASTGDEVRIFGDGSAVRDYVEVRDVASCVVQLCAIAGGDPILNVGSGVGHRIDEVVQVVEEVTGRAIAVTHAPARPSDPRAVVLDVERLRGLVDWRPMALRDGIAAAWSTRRPDPPGR